MAKRSDFAQKLLDDLRLRKERMAASQSSKGSKPVAGDPHAYSKQTYRGSREMKTHQMKGTTNGSTHNRPGGSNKSLYIEDASKQIVPFGRGQSSEQIGGLSVALAFALENGGKLQRVDSSGNSSMLSFLHQISRRSVDTSMMTTSSQSRRQSSSHFPMLSHFHIQEIEKGAQKLNQILRACSNGLNFDRYSIEIGKELLKGAIDLEESLRMLVNLQEASEYMISPQSKSRITLLDEDEDDNDNTVSKVENKQLDLPRFSFDKPKRNSHYIQETAINDLKLRLMALTYSPETANFNQNVRTFSASNSVSHKRSASNGSSVKNFATHSEQKHLSTSSKSKPEKGRIPNVVAKLMGLEELPESEDSKYTTKKETSSKQKSDGKVIKKAAGGSTMHDQKKKDAENLLLRTKKQEKMQSNHIRVIQDTTYGTQAEMKAENRHQLTIYEGKLSGKDVERTKAIRGSNKANIKMDKNQNNIAQPNQSTGSRKDIQEREKKQDNKKFKEHKGKEENKELALTNEIQQIEQQTKKVSNAATASQRQSESKVIILQTEKRDANRLLFNNQPKSPRDLESQQPCMSHKSEPQDKRHEIEQHGARQKSQARWQKEIDAVTTSLPKTMDEAVKLREKNLHTTQVTSSNRTPTEYVDTMQSKGFSNCGHHQDLQYKSSINFNNTQDSMDKDLGQNSAPKIAKSEFTKEKNNTPTAMKGTLVHLQAIQKVKSTKSQKVEKPRKVDEPMVRRSARPPKNQSSVTQEMKLKRREKLGALKEAEQVRVSRWKEAEAHFVKPEQPVTSMQQSNQLSELEVRAEQASNLQSHRVSDECQSLWIINFQSLVQCNNNVVATRTIDHQAQVFSKDELKSSCIVPNQRNGTQDEEMKNISHPTQLENQKAAKVEIKLTESENQLKQILIKSQVFINTAEALFKLNTPLGILDSGGHDCHDQESKLLLDCGYEIMRRRGKRQELGIPPFVTSPKLSSLDELIKQLSKDFEKLRFYGRYDNPQLVVEDYLPRMLESDVYGAELDVSCMWDMGWDTRVGSLVGKEEVVKDVEKHVLNGLLDEVTRDLLLLVC